MPESVRLIIRGPKDRLGALLDTALEPHVDLTGLQPGRVTLPVKVTAIAPDIEVVRIEPESSGDDQVGESSQAVG